MNRAPRKTRRERRGPFVKPRALAVPQVLIYQEIGMPEETYDCNRGGDAFPDEAADTIWRHAGRLPFVCSMHKRDDAYQILLDPAAGYEEMLAVSDLLMHCDGGSLRDQSVEIFKPGNPHHALGALLRER